MRIHITGRAFKLVLVAFAFPTLGCAYEPGRMPLHVTLMPYAVECQVKDVPATFDSIPLFISIRNISHNDQGVEYRYLQRRLSIDLFLDGQPIRRKAGSRSTGFTALRKENEESTIGVGEGGGPTTISMGERARYMFRIEREFDLPGPGRYLVVVHYCYEGQRELLYIPGSATFSIGGPTPDPIKWHNP